MITKDNFLSVIMISSKFVDKNKKEMLSLWQSLKRLNIHESDQMKDAGYTSEQALEKAIELVKTQSKEKAYSELLKMTGYKENKND